MGGPFDADAEAHFDEVAEAFAKLTNVDRDVQFVVAVPLDDAAECHGLMGPWARDRGERLVNCLNRAAPHWRE